MRLLFHRAIQYEHKRMTYLMGTAGGLKRSWIGAYHLLRKTIRSYRNITANLTLRVRPNAESESQLEHKVALYETGSLEK